MASRPDATTRTYDRIAKERPAGDDGELVSDGPGNLTRFLCAVFRRCDSWPPSSEAASPDRVPSSIA